MQTKEETGCCCHDNQTGKPIELGGLEGRLEATGYGVAYITSLALDHLGTPLQGATVAIQGFGKR